MPYDIPLSQLGDQVDAFKLAVENHILRLDAFNKTVGKPRPTASPLIEASITRIQTKGQPDKYVADYNIIDDTPHAPPPLDLNDKKMQLHIRLLAVESMAKDAILPPRKKRLASIQYEQAMVKPEEERSDEDKAIIAHFLEINKKWLDIGALAAQAESDIEDLIEDNVDSWQVPTFG